MKVNVNLDFIVEAESHLDAITKLGKTLREQKEYGRDCPWDKVDFVDSRTVVEVETETNDNQAENRD